MAAAQGAQGGEGSGSRQRRRRDRGGYGGQQVSGQLQSHGPANHRGARHGDGTTVNGSAKVERGSGGHYAGHDFHNGYGVGHGHSDGRNGKGRGGGRDYHRAPDPIPYPAPPEEQSLKDLLLQVAPQARIAENTSRLSSKASVNIYAKVLSRATEQEQAVGASGSSADRGDNYGSQNPASVQPRPSKPEEDEESAFMERWSGLFSQGSPLVNGTLEDPFSDLKKRAKVVWKKKSERSGHRTRYQERKMRKQQDDADDIEGNEDGEAEGGASVVYDASKLQWQPQRPPEQPEGY